MQVRVLPGALFLTINSPFRTDRTRVQCWINCPGELGNQRSPWQLARTMFSDQHPGSAPTYSPIVLGHSVRSVRVVRLAPTRGGRCNWKIYENTRFLTAKMRSLTKTSAGICSVWDRFDFALSPPFKNARRFNRSMNRVSNLT